MRLIRLLSRRRDTHAVLAYGYGALPTLRAHHLAVDRDDVASTRSLNAQHRRCNADLWHERQRYRDFELSAACDLDLLLERLVSRLLDSEGASAEIEHERLIQWRLSDLGTVDEYACSVGR